MLKIKEELEKMVKDTELFANRYKQAMEIAQQKAEKLNKYDLTELLNYECLISFNKAYYMALSNKINDLKKILYLVEKIEQ